MSILNKSMSKAYKHVWILLVVVQIAVIIWFIDGMSNYGLYNPDAFSYHVHWSKVSQTFNPFAEAILADPGHDLVRLPFSMPHFLIGLTSSLTGPVTAYLIWSCIGVVATYFSLLFFAMALGLRDKYAYCAALVHYVFFHIISQLPPLSGNQLKYVLNALLLSSESIQHFGPRQYPHDILFYPLLYTVLALTLKGINYIKEGKEISEKYLLLWAGLCLLMPLNYFYHWFQFAFVVLGVGVCGLLLKWWKINILFGSYRKLLMAFVTVVAGWCCILLFQNGQLADEAGYRFSLMGGLTEARFTLLPMGFIVRAVFWSVVVLILLRANTNAVLLSIFLIGCVVLMNMQLITGKNIQPGHWTFGSDRIFAWMAVLIVVDVGKKFLSRWTTYMYRAAMGLSLIFFILITYTSWKYFEKMSRWNQERVELISYLKTQPSSVILAPEIWIETDILIHAPQHYSFIQRGAQSALDVQEHWERLTHAAFVLGYSKEGFIKWLHIRSVRFFGMLYGTEKEFSSSYFYDPEKKAGVLKFNEGQLPEWDIELVDAYAKSDGLIQKRMDLVVLHQAESMPVGAEVIFENSGFKVYRAPKEVRKEWGTNFPIPEKKYPVVR